MSHKFRTLAPIFTNGASFSQEFSILCHFVIDLGFPHLMPWFNEDAVSCKQIFSDDALRRLFPNNLLSSDALYPALLPAPKFAITGEQGELRKSLIIDYSYNFISVTFLVLFIFTHISLIFLRRVLDLNLSNPAKYYFDRAFIISRNSVKFTFPLFLLL